MVMTDPDEWDFDGDAMQRVEISLVHYLDQLMAGYFDNDNGYYYGTISGLPFCGCSTCMGREMIAWLIPRLGEMYQKGQLWHRS